MRSGRSAVNEEAAAVKKAIGKTEANCMQLHLIHVARYSFSSPFTVQDVLDAGLGDDGIVAFEPLILVLADEGGVMATLQCPLVVHHRKQTVPEPEEEREEDT